MPSAKQFVVAGSPSASCQPPVSTRLPVCNVQLVPVPFSLHRDQVAIPATVPVVATRYSHRTLLKVAACLSQDDVSERPYERNYGAPEHMLAPTSQVDHRKGSLLLDLRRPIDLG